MRNNWGSDSDGSSVDSGVVSDIALVSVTAKLWCLSENRSVLLVKSGHGWVVDGHDGFLDMVNWVNYGNMVDLLGVDWGMSDGHLGDVTSGGEAEKSEGKAHCEHVEGIGLVTVKSW